MKIFWIFLSAGILLSFFLEKNIIQFPLFFLCSFLIAVSTESIIPVVILSILAFFFDAILMNPVGATTLFFVLSLAVYVYNPFSFDNTNPLFQFFCAVLFGGIYIILFGYPIHILQFIGFFGMIGVLYYSLHLSRNSHEVTLS